VLDVVTQLEAAIQLDQTSGWMLLGAVTVPLGGDLAIEERVYRGPISPPDHR
jgi:hypothetical protein